MQSKKNSFDPFIVQLDSYIALEALISNRLMSFAPAHRQVWLRRILVKGFCADCAEMRASQRAAAGVHAMEPASREEIPPSVADVRTDDATPNAEIRQAVLPATPATALSALRAVMG